MGFLVGYVAYQNLFSFANACVHAIGCDEILSFIDFVQKFVTNTHAANEVPLIKYHAVD